MKKIGIIGAGISGLYIANLFKKNPKYQVSIFDKKSSLNIDEGYGVQLSVNSIKFLNEIGFNKYVSGPRVQRVLSGRDAHGLVVFQLPRRFG